MLLRKCVCVCARACARVSVDNFPLELNMGLEKKNTRQAVSIVQVLSIGQAPRDSWLLAASVLFTHVILAGECNVSFYCFFFFNYFII